MVSSRFQGSHPGLAGTPVMHQAAVVTAASMPGSEHTTHKSIIFLLSRGSQQLVCLLQLRETWCFALGVEQQATDMQALVALIEIQLLLQCLSAGCNVHDKQVSCNLQHHVAG